MTKIHETTNSRFDPNLLLNIKGFNLDGVLIKEPDFLDTSAEHQHDTSVSSIALQHKDPVNIGKLQDWIQVLIDEKSADLFRYKGVINVAGEARKFVFQGVHMLFTGSFTEEWKEGEERDSRFVFIGRNLDKQDITDKFLACSVDLLLRFPVGMRILAKTRKGKTLRAFDKGETIALWNEGNPYRIRLECGNEVWAHEDDDEFVMELTPELEADYDQATSHILKRKTAV